MGDSVMLAGQIEGVQISPLQKIDVDGGDVYHAMKQSDAGYEGFGEAYFSFVEPLSTKAWKQHTKMTLNLIVPVGAVRVVIVDERVDSTTCGQFQEVILSPETYQRLTVPPMLWVGFQGIAGITSMMLNVANIEHCPDESSNVELGEIQFDWTNES
jgi:dTDP-4-dehydrorhamnose 3,5-epimerase